MKVIRLTIREASESIYRRFGGRRVPEWKLRRVVDVLESRGMLDVQRMGAYRTVAAEDVGILAAEMRRCGWHIPDAEAIPC
jgi:hypothetical protein